MARLVSFLAVFLIPLTASSAAAAGSLSPALGGSGGDAFVTNCSDDEVLVGVRVRADAWLDSIASRCVKVTDAGAWQGTVRTLAVAGGTRGFPATRDCPRNYAVQWIFGKGQCFRQSASPRMPPPDLADRPSEKQRAQAHGVCRRARWRGVRTLPLSRRSAGDRVAGASWGIRRSPATLLRAMTVCGNAVTARGPRGNCAGNPPSE